ncbi:hypothetical protein [Rubripirellula tenax]|nr:hypothetical protein [Rubripirellula tenax]
MSRANGEFNAPSRASSFFSLSAVPYMIGDTTAGACSSFELAGTSAATISHPTYGCSRLNISENNSPVLADRFYASYRHFHNASEIDLFSTAPIGGRNTLDINLLTLGLERKLTENSSVEIRLPITSQLSSDLQISQTTGPVVSLPLNDTEVAIGNVGVILKFALFHTDRVYWSAGLATNIPTAPDVNIQVTTQDDQYVILDPITGTPVTPPFRFDAQFRIQRANDTVNLSPFLASVFHFSDSFYGLGFVQLDVPVNDSDVRTSGFYSVEGATPTRFDETEGISQQVLMRLNVGLGKQIWSNPNPCGFVNAVNLLAEVHYTTTLNDADLVGPVTIGPPLGNGAATVTNGNLANRVDTFNGLLGAQVQVQKTIITNGFAAPFRDGADRGFDFEYNFSINRLF